MSSSTNEVGGGRKHDEGVELVNIHTVPTDVTKASDKLSENDDLVTEISSQQQKTSLSQVSSADVLFFSFHYNYIKLCRFSVRCEMLGVASKYSLSAEQTSSKNVVKDVMWTVFKQSVCF